MFLGKIHLHGHLFNDSSFFFYNFVDPKYIYFSSSYQIRTLTITKERKVHYTKTNQKRKYKILSPKSFFEQLGLKLDYVYIYT